MKVDLSQSQTAMSSSLNSARTEAGHHAGPSLQLLNSWDLLRASSSPLQPWREGPEMTQNGHSPERLHTAENGEINRNCSSTKHAFCILNFAPCCSELPPFNCIQNESPSGPFSGKDRGKKRYILLLACHCGVEIIIVFF